VGHAWGLLYHGLSPTVHSFLDNPLFMTYSGNAGIRMLYTLDVGLIHLQLGVFKPLLIQ